LNQESLEEETIATLKEIKKVFKFGFVQNKNSNFLFEEDELQDDETYTWRLKL